MLRHRSLIAAIALAVGSTLVVSGCARDDAASYVASAKSYLEKSDPKAAIIQLRNAREKAPDNAEVRFLLGKALLDNGEAGAAETELRKALALGYPSDAIQPVLALALLGQGEFRKVVSQFGDVTIADPRARADLLATLGVAQFAQGDRDAARKSIEAAVAAAPDSARALTARGQLLAMAGDFDGAAKAFDAALAASPNDPEPAVLRAGLLSAQGKRDQAIELLSATLAANPSSMIVRTALVPLLLSSGNVARAETEVAVMLKQAPQDFRTVYSDALVAFAKGNLTKARDLAQQLVAARPSHVPSLYLFALANYALKSWSVAEDALRKVVQAEPNDVRPHRLLVASYLRSGRVVQAAETGAAALKRFPDDAVLQRLAGEAQVLNGNPTGAVRHFELAAKQEKEGSVSRIRLAQINFARGDANQAIADLEGLSAADTSAIQADLALYSAHMSRREYDKALAVTATIEKKQPGALAHELRGNVLLAKRDYAGARASFSKALEADPGRLSTARSLAGLDLLENKGGDARARFEKMIAADPRNEEFRIALAEVQAVSGASPAEVRATLEKAIADNPASAAARLALITYLRRNGDVAGSLAAARAAVAALPESPQVVEALGIAQLANSEFGQARETFVRLVELQPRSAAALLRLADAYFMEKDYAAALEVQRKALAIDPENTVALGAIARTQLAAGKPGEAIIDAKRIQKQHPDKATGFALEAEVLMAQKKYSEAALVLQQALARQPNSALAGRYHVVLVQAGRTQEANAFVERWTKEHPKDSALLALVGQQRQAAKDVAGATAAYRAALAIEPDNFVVLNNLAWMLNEQGKPEALELAERAHRLAPLNPQVIDTLGTVLVAQGDVQRGIATLRMGVNLAPEDVRLRLHLAKGLAKAGDKAGARRELDAVIARSQRPSPVKAEAEALLKTL